MYKYLWWRMTEKGLLQTGWSGRTSLRWGHLSWALTDRKEPALHIPEGRALQAEGVVSAGVNPEWPSVSCGCHAAVGVHWLHAGIMRREHSVWYVRVVFWNIKNTVGCSSEEEARVWVPASSLTSLGLFCCRSSGGRCSFFRRRMLWCL